MSILTEIERIEEASNDIGAALTENSIDVPEGTTLSGYAPIIRLSGVEFDTTPTENSTNAVTSGGVKVAIDTAMQNAGGIGSKDPIELDTDLQIVVDKANKDSQGNVIHTTYAPLTNIVYASETVKGMARIWVTTEDGETVLNIATEDE